MVLLDVRLSFVFAPSAGEKTRKTKHGGKNVLRHRFYPHGFYVTGHQTHRKTHIPRCCRGRYFAKVLVFVGYVYVGSYRIAYVLLVNSPLQVLLSTDTYTTVGAKLISGNQHDRVAYLLYI